MGVIWGGGLTTAIPEDLLQSYENDPVGLPGPVFRPAEDPCRSGSYPAPVAPAPFASTRAVTAAIDIAALPVNAKPAVRPAVVLGAGTADHRRVVRIIGTLSVSVGLAAAAWGITVPKT